MITEETTKYLSIFMAFLVEQRLKARDPKIEELIAEVNRELSKRRKLTAGPVI